MQPHQTKSAWPLMLCAAAILMITMGARQSMGLFIAPINQSTGLGIVSISFALAIALAGIAALACLPIREAKLPQAVPA